MVGKTDPTNVIMAKEHFAMLQDMRKNQPEKYKKLVFFATIYPSIRFADQKTQLATFFKTDF
jgi:hypothetical protein